MISRGLEIELKAYIVLKFINKCHMREFGPFRGQTEADTSISTPFHIEQFPSIRFQGSDKIGQALAHKVQESIAGCVYKALSMSDAVRTNFCVETLMRRIRTPKFSANCLNRR